MVPYCLCFGESKGKQQAEENNLQVNGCERHLHFSLQEVGNTSNRNGLEMVFLNLKWLACLNFIAAADFHPKISVLQLLLKIYGATWDQSKHIFSLLCKLGLCATYALHPYTLCRNSCSSKGKQPILCAVRPEMWKNRIISWWLMVVWFCFLHLSPK